MHSLKATHQVCSAGTCSHDWHKIDFGKTRIVDRTRGWWNSVFIDAVRIRTSENLMNHDRAFQLIKAWDPIIAAIKTANGKNTRQNPQDEDSRAAHDIPASPYLNLMGVSEGI